jgi:hypothetical protein
MQCAVRMEGSNLESGVGGFPERNQSLREPGSPLTIISVAQVPAPWLILLLRAITQNTTTSNHRPHRTGVNYHTTTLQPSYCEWGQRGLGKN